MFEKIIKVRKNRAAIEKVDITDLKIEQDSSDKNTRIIRLEVTCLNDF